MKIESGASQGKDFGEEMLAIRKAKRDLISQFSLSALKVVDPLDQLDLVHFDVRSSSESVHRLADKSFQINCK